VPFENVENASPELSRDAYLYSLAGVSQPSEATFSIFNLTVRVKIAELQGIRRGRTLPSELG
jgi:hypothetical protein